jgi:peptide/nickel transport system substrate-binding protein
MTELRKIDVAAGKDTAGPAFAVGRSLAAPPLYRRCDPAELPFAVCTELEEAPGLIGQERAVEAVLDGTELCFRLREGVHWHDGQPFTAKDVQCTWDMLLGRSAARFRISPRKSWYWNLDRVTTNGDYQATFHLKQPQPALLALLASGYSPVYPCHVPPQDMRQHPIGTGPFKFVSYKQNEAIRVTRNRDYWKPDRPYLEGIEWTISLNRSTALLAFVAGKLDMTFPYEVTVPLLKDI